MTIDVISYQNTLNSTTLKSVIISLTQTVFKWISRVSWHVSERPKSKYNHVFCMLALLKIIMGTWENYSWNSSFLSICYITTHFASICLYFILCTSCCHVHGLREMIIDLLIALISSFAVTVCSHVGYCNCVNLISLYPIQIIKRKNFRLLS